MSRIAKLLIQPVVIYVNLFNRMLDRVCGTSERDI